jgi:TonB family protein
LGWKKFLTCILLMTVVGTFSTGAIGAEYGKNSPVEIIYREDPHYPQTAQKLGFEGVIRLSVPVDCRGQVGQPILIEPAVTGPGPHVLSNAAIWAAKRSKFKPAIENGGPVDSEIEMTYEFICPRDSLGKPMIEPAVVKPPLRHPFTVQPGQLCLFGHWISGDIEVIQIESRVYVGGIRVYLSQPTRKNRSKNSDKAQLEDLAQECNWLHRDLLILGHPWSYVDSEVFRLISEYPANLECEEIGPGEYRVRIGGSEKQIFVSKDYPPFDYTQKQERVYLGQAEGRFFHWLSRLDRGDSVLKSQFVESSIAVDHPLSDFVKECGLSGRTPSFSAEQIADWGLSSGIEEMLLEPAWVFKQ